MSSIRKADASAINTLRPYIDSILKDVFKLNSNEVFVSDFSDFSDFQGAGNFQALDWFQGVQQSCLSRFAMAPEHEHETLLEFAIKLASLTCTKQ